MGQRSISQLLAHWDTMLESVQASPLSVYDAIEAAIISRALPDVVLSRAEHREGGPFSARREYLRVRRKNLIFDINVALYGDGMILSWWLGEATPGVCDLFIELPLIGSVIESWRYPATYYAIEATSFFQRAVHNCVLEVVDQLSEKSKLRLLSQTERRPVLSDYYEW